MHRAAQVHPSATVEVGSYVMAGARVAGEAKIRSTAVVGAGVVVGENTEVHSGVKLTNCAVGASCILHIGACVGADGFGFTHAPDGTIVVKPQEMGVVIEEGVVLGANTCVDRGSWRDTRIGAHTKVDNLVQIGHNAKACPRPLVLGSGECLRVLTLCFPPRHMAVAGRPSVHPLCPRCPWRLEYAR